MKHRNLLFLSALALAAFLIPTSAFAQCVIGGTNYNEGEFEIETPCEVCDSARNATDWSPLICLPTLVGVDAACQVSGCDSKKGCVSQKLPEHTRCVAPTCSNGAINQTECSTDGICNEERVKSCQGFACLDGTSCTTECVNNEDCQSPAICDGQTCKIPVVSEDMGMDTSVPDMGQDMTANVDLPTLDMGATDMKKESDADNSNPIASGGSCATSNGSSWFGLLLFGFFATIRRAKKRV